VIWLGFFLYCLGVVPTWCFVFEGLEPRGFLRAWAIASVLALVWPLFLLQFRVWTRRQSKSWVNEVETYLRTVEKAH
jgi:hypothetical protein